MNLEMRWSLVFTLLFISTACSGPQSRLKVDASSPAPAFDVQEAQEDLRSGKLRFEIRGLVNEPTKTDYGATIFKHTAVVVPGGDSKYGKGTYLLICSVRRTAGGDPEASRKQDDYSLVIVRDGIGRLTESGGYRTKSEKWDPEKIEIRPYAAFVGTLIDGTPVEEK